MIILGIETSCDETAVAIYDGNAGLLSHCIHSQIDIHAVYGGVVPELASRDHIRKALPLIQKALGEANLTKKDLHGIAYTKGPGLIGALMVGASLAKSLSFALQIPALGIHHMESHLMAIGLEKAPPDYPFLALLVSGGHTLLVRVEAFQHYEILGESIDDAVGEAFDKTAKLLGLPYPGGPALAKLAEQGNPSKFHFPRPMMKSENLNFSFSGLKTHAVNCFKKYGDDGQVRADIAYAFEEAAVDTLVQKTCRALKETKLNKLVLVGGVAANRKLRERLSLILTELSAQVYYPRPEFCTDNGAMVAYNGWLHFMAGEKEGNEIAVKPRWAMTEINRF